MSMVDWGEKADLRRRHDRRGYGESASNAHVGKVVSNANRVITRIEDEERDFSPVEQGDRRGAGSARRSLWSASMNGCNAHDVKGGGPRVRGPVQADRSTDRTTRPRSAVRPSVLRPSSKSPAQDCTRRRNGPRSRHQRQRQAASPPGRCATSRRRSCSSSMRPRSQRLVEAAVRASEHRLEAERGHRGDGDGEHSAASASSKRASPQGQRHGAATSGSLPARRWPDRRMSCRQYVDCLLSDEGYWLSTRGVPWQGKPSRSGWRSTTADIGIWPREIARDRDHRRWECRLADTPAAPRSAAGATQTPHSSRALLAVDGKGERQNRDQAID